MEKLISNKNNFDVGIVGAGVAGLYSAYCSLISGLRCVLFDTLACVGGQCTSFYPDKKVYGVPGFLDITASSFIDLLYRQTFGLSEQPFLINEKVVKIDRLSDGLFSINDKEYLFNNIIVAAGIGDMQPLQPFHILGIEKGYEFVQYYCMKTDLYKNKEVIIAGGGNSAADFAIEISRIAKKVIIIHRRDKLSCDFHKLNNLLNIDNIEVKLSENILDIKEDHSIVTDNTIYNIDYIVFCYGFKTNRFFVNGIETNEKGLIDVDVFTMETKISSIYAIGDIVEYKNKKKNIISCFYEADKAVRTIKEKRE